MKDSAAPDRYDAAIAYLRERPFLIHAAYHGAIEDLGGAGCLFAFASPDGQYHYPSDYGGDPFDSPCGCPMLIRMYRRQFWAGEFQDCYVGWTARLTAAIQRDSSLPDHWKQITVDHLSAFAYWQRRLDREIRSGPRLAAFELAESQWRARREAAEVGL